jgi:phage terminase large subunit-like protein
MLGRLAFWPLAPKPAERMARPAKTLSQHLRDGSFRARRHHTLLNGPVVGGKTLERLQKAYGEAATERERRAIALDFELVARSEVGNAIAHFDEPVSVADFFERNLQHRKGPAAGQPFRLEPWQARFVDELYRVDERGNRIYKRAILGIPRGNGKSPIAAGVGLFELMTRRDEPDIVCAAASRDQAAIVYEYARSFAESGPLAEQLVIGRREIARPETRGVLRTISADGYVAHGLNPSVCVIDEAHAFTTDKQRELFEAIDTAVHKRPDAFWLLISTSGHDRSSLFGKLYSDVLEQLEPEHPEPGLTVARDEANGVLMFWYGADAECDADDERVWRAVNPAGWVSLEELRRQRNSPSMQATTFKRRHLNAWVAPDAERWIRGDRWEALADPAARIPQGASVCLGLDGSRTYDTTAVALASRAADGRIDVDAHIFSARAEAPHHTLHSAGRIDFSDLEAFVLDLFDRFEPRAAGFDPRFLDRSMEVIDARLPDATIVRIEPTSKTMREALMALERGIAEGIVRHRGDPVIAEHFAWAGVDRGESNELRRLYKLDRRRPIDAAVAIALAYYVTMSVPVRKSSRIVSW